MNCCFIASPELYVRCGVSFFLLFNSIRYSNYASEITTIIQSLRIPNIEWKAGCNPMSSTTSEEYFPPLSSSEYVGITLQQRIEAAITSPAYQSSADASLSRPENWNNQPQKFSYPFGSHDRTFFSLRSIQLK